MTTLSYISPHVYASQKSVKICIFVAIWNQWIKCPWKIGGMFWITFAIPDTGTYHSKDVPSRGWRDLQEINDTRNAWSKKENLGTHRSGTHWHFSNIQYSTLKRGAVPMAPQIRVTVYCAAIIRQFLVVLVRLMVLKWVSSPRSPTFARGNCDASTKRPQPVFILSIKSSLNDFIPNKW